ncbi:MAG: hypothetical protein ACE5I1_21545, partial [bacterium]
TIFTLLSSLKFISKVHRGTYPRLKQFSQFCQALSLSSIADVIYQHLLRKSETGPDAHGLETIKVTAS